MTDYTSIFILLNIVLGTLGGIGGFFLWATGNDKSLFWAAFYGVLKTLLLTACMAALVVTLAFLTLTEPLAFSNKLQQLQLGLIYLIPAPFFGSLLAYAAACYSRKVQKRQGSG